jgi:hypothetical protein
VFCIVGLSALLWIGGGILTLFLPEAMKGFAGLVSAVGFAMFALMLVFSFFFGRTRCPRCRKPFYTSEGFKGVFQKINYLTTHCVHCGQSMNVEPDVAPNSPPPPQLSESPALQASDSQRTNSSGGGR